MRSWPILAALPAAAATSTAPATQTARRAGQRTASADHREERERADRTEPGPECDEQACPRSPPERDQRGRRDDRVQGGEPERVVPEREDGYGEAEGEPGGLGEERDQRGCDGGDPERPAAGEERQARA